MKKFIYFISLFLFFIVPVKADITEDNLVYQNNEDIISYIYNNLMTEYQNYSEFPYFNIDFAYYDLDENYHVQDTSQSYITGFLYYFTENNNYSSDAGRVYIDYRCRPDCVFTTYRESGDNPNYGSFNPDVLSYNSFLNYAGNLLLPNGDSPNYFINTINNRYITVNLDNYEYVLLSLKDYSRTTAFSTNLQVKGQIGITPIYNYGQTSKDAITGSQVQDRCNVSYNDFTSYPFYIIQSDLQNNVIYAVKECSSNSSFKYDSSIFDITYITSSNVDNPTITIDGKTYDVIPYTDLPSTATKNEENNYIPGESGSATDSGGLDSAIKTIQQSLSTLWNTFTYFTDLVGLIFSSLPTELRTILLSAFIVAITIGLIKLFVK